ncbi:MAG: glycosyltransferase family 2 protein [Holdemanella biformis]|uniref:glycosyltransferase family 2 protein n=1 Tax=Holdemanella biformis TaxID=1735 RepID=UPI00242C5BCC|nr:glycosyltransferase family 2 protein [Holdemanella biformis]MBS6455079.1 glycosyltransferase family 2 protein [Holdemanella biformis]
MIEELVSIVVPVYNMGNSLEVCVDSLLKQKYYNIEIVLVDDGSRDNSLEVCYKLQKRDSRIQVYHTENRGSGPARNTGIEKATGRYIYFPDADDKLEEDAIGILVDAMENGRYDLVVFGYQSIDAKGNVVLKKQYPDMKRNGEDVRQDYSDYVVSTRRYGIQGAPWNKFFDLNVIRKHSIRYPSLRRHQDEGFISRYMCYVKNIHFIKAILYNHYLNDLKKEWDKYPVDYVDAVIGLYQTRKETILTWNKKDRKTKEIVEHEYICNIIKAFELSYSPKMKLSSRNRLKWIRKQIERSQVLKVVMPLSLGRYQKIIFTLLKKRHINLAILIMHIKIIIEKNGGLDAFRRLQ